tara:strand:+ start:3227 stop:3514 length:288 start_codon:yes stop_codon:yes gene_type:complete
MNTITVQFEEDHSFGEGDQMNNPEYTIQVVEHCVLHDHDIENTALRLAEEEISELIDGDFDDLEIMGVWVGNTDINDDDWTCQVSVVVTYNVTED